MCPKGRTKGVGEERELVSLIASGWVDRGSRREADGTYVGWRGKTLGVDRAVAHISQDGGEVDRDGREAGVDQEE